MKHLRITVEGKAYHVIVEKLDSDETNPGRVPTVHATPAQHVARPVAKPQAAKAAGDVGSPLAGVVKSLDVAVGTQVKAGDLILTLEAMKMYTSMNAPTDGTVTAFHVSVGDAVDEDQPLYTLG
jgi:biotin carboxyl carrier protein